MCPISVKMLKLNVTVVQETLQAGQRLLKQSDPDAQRANEIIEKLYTEVDIFRQKFDNTLQIAGQLQLSGNVYV